MADARVGADSAQQLTAVIGQRLRQARAERGWSQEALARRAEVSPGMIIQIEQGRTNPSIGILVRLSEALGVRLAALVEDPPTRFPVIRRRRDATELWSDGAGSAGHLRIAGPGPDQLELWEWHLEPGAQHDSEPHPAGTIEILLVQTGTLGLATPRIRHQLHPGDAIAFPADSDHRYTNDATESTTFIHVHYQPARPQLNNLDA